MKTTKQVPFDLQKCINGAKVVTRDGRDFKFLAYDANLAAISRLVGNINNCLASYYEDGKYWVDKECMNDLFILEEVEECEGWINVYEGACWTGIYQSKEEAISFSAKGIVDTIKITWHK